MTALGLLHPGHSAEDDYPRMEQLLGSDIRVDLARIDIGEDAHRVDALRELGAPERLAAGCEALRLSGAEAVVWACAGGSFVLGHEGAHEQIRALARTAGLPASSTAFAFVHAAREVHAARVAVASTYPDDVTRLVVDFLTAGGLEVVSAQRADVTTAAQVAAWTVDDILALARNADRPEAQALLLPDTALRTVSHVPALEKELGKPVLTATQVSVWEALRLADRRVNAPELGALFTREPIVQA
ncbi:maleate cis-trans isomerase family protein [Streptomyces sp. HM190]|uniref:maleate cis-trans isomerase family protein n=1 Tax=Streptomyces sp. HM190 TaxID=2695266 RepID=UPI001358A5CE|nr:decarboxylase [Streptomyces sp. HM190]